MIAAWVLICMLWLVQPDTGAAESVGLTMPAAPATASKFYAARLAELRPTRPMAYFELAEEVAAEFRTSEGRTLARELYVLAIYAPSHAASMSSPADVRSAEQGPPWLASSACRGLAALAESEQERRWLVALAGTLSPGDSSPVAEQQVQAATHDAAALQLATALGLVRSGEGRRAQRLLTMPAVSELLRQYERLLSPGGLTGGGERVLNLAERFPSCPQCRNRRIIKDADGARLCPTCHGRPGPNISTSELIGQLRLESLLLNGIQRSWAAQTVADGGAPLRELDPSVLLDVYNVDPARSLWRDGAWVDGRPKQTPKAEPGEGPAKPVNAESGGESDQ